MRGSIGGLSSGRTTGKSWVGGVQSGGEAMWTYNRLQDKLPMP